MNEFALEELDRFQGKKVVHDECVWVPQTCDNAPDEWNNVTTVSE